LDDDLGLLGRIPLTAACLRGRAGLTQSQFCVKRARAQTHRLSAMRSLCFSSTSGRLNRIELSDRHSNSSVDAPAVGSVTLAPFFASSVNYE
jgi:hypothetical protein